jgi:hypothetical protein
MNPSSMQSACRVPACVAFVWQVATPIVKYKTYSGTQMHCGSGKAPQLGKLLVACVHAIKTPNFQANF